MPTHSIRHLPGWAIVRRFRELGLTQAGIGRRVGASQSFVSEVINRRGPMTPKARRVWDAIEQAVEKAGGAAA